MHDRKISVRASVLAAAAACATTTAAALDPQQFVAGWPIVVPADADVFDVPLTAEVYAAASDVEQLAVLDMNGTPLPFFRRSALQLAPTQRRIVLEASPLYEGGTAGAGPNVGVTTSERGTSVTVTPGATAAPGVVAFVLDARTVTDAPTALELDWRPLPQPFLVDVRVEQSTNLTDWRPVGDAGVAALSIGGVEVRHMRVPVRAAAGGYYRITVERAVPDWYLQRAVLVVAETPVATPVVTRLVPLPASARPAEALANALFVDAGAALPVAALDLKFWGSSGFARADVAGSNSLEGPWLPLVSGELFYTLTYEGRDFANEPLTMGRRELRYWRVLPAAPLRDSSVELELRFPQEYLRVQLTGHAPLLLAAGTLAADAGPDATFAAVWSKISPSPSTMPVAQLGARRELGGPAVLAAPKPFPWRIAVLWAVLLGGAFMVGAMAVRLAREMKRTPS